MGLRDKKSKSILIDSPQGHLIKEVALLGEAENKIKDLEQKNIELEGQVEDLKKQFEMGITEEKKAEIVKNLKKDDEVKMLTEKALIFEHKSNILSEELLKADERNKLLLSEQIRVKDKYELDIDWQKLNSEVRTKAQELDKIQKGIETLRIVKTEEIADLNSIREKYNHEVEEIKKIYEVKREVTKNYAEFRKKADKLPPAFMGELPKFYDNKKPGFFAKIFKRKR